MTATYNRRTYTLAAGTESLPLLRADLIARGWDGTVYYGISTPTGRQTSAPTAMFYRSIKTGEFSAV